MCKKGCKTRGCGCRKKNQICGPSCECCNCTNNVQSDTTCTSQSISTLTTHILPVQESSTESEEDNCDNNPCLESEQDDNQSRQ